MSSKVNIWSGGRGKKPSLLNASYREGDMRAQLRGILYGSSREVPKAQRGIYRRTRLDSDGKKIACPCTDDWTEEPQIEPPCPVCLGMGFLWDEIWFDYYKVVTGLDSSMALRDDPNVFGITNIPRIIFYTHEDLQPVIIRGICDDRIVELDRDAEGNVILPYNRSRVYRIGTAIDYRADRGRLEYWKFTVVSHDMDSRGVASDV